MILGFSRKNHLSLSLFVLIASSLWFSGFCLPSASPTGPTALPALGASLAKPKNDLPLEPQLVPNEVIDMSKTTDSASELRQRGGQKDVAGSEEQDKLKAAPTKSVFGALASPSTVSVLLVIATAAVFYQVKSSGTAAASTSDENKNYVLGLAIAGIALIGNAAVGALRKILSQHNVGSAQQVGLATMIQGVVSIAYCIHSGQLDAGPHFIEKLPHADFWIAAIGSSALGAVVKTLETKAFAESDISLCAPFLAFDPVMQFVVGVAVMPLTCSLFRIGCDEAKSSYPAYHVLSVACIAYGAFLLGFSGKAPAKPGAAAVKYLGPLPVGSWYILLNCVIYGFTSRMDKVAPPPRANAQRRCLGFDLA